MSASNYADLRRHVGHAIVCVGYGTPRDQAHGREPVNVAIECETCGEVLLDFDAPAVPAPMPGQTDLVETIKEIEDAG